MIEIRNLHKSFGKNHVLKGINISLNNNGITAILGPNGSGKTTLIKSILGLVRPDKGDILFNNESILRKSQYRNQVDYLPQIAEFPDNLRVNELLKMVKDIREEEADESRLIQYFELSPYTDKKIRYLSGGTRQKVNVVLSFMFDSPVLILDEPTVGLDPVALIRLKELINEERKKDKSIIFTTHIMTLVEEIADEIIFLLEGNIYFKGPISDMISTNKQDTLEKSIAAILTSEKND